MKDSKRLTWIESYADERSNIDPAFKTGLNRELALLEQIRSQNSAEAVKANVLNEEPSKALQSKAPGRPLP